MFGTLSYIYIIYLHKLINQFLKGNSVKLKLKVSYLKKICMKPFVAVV